MNVQTNMTAPSAAKAPVGDAQARDRLSPFAIRRQLELLDERELATFVGVDLRTIHRWRAEGRGPAFIKVGNAVLFRLADIRDWLDRRVEQTAEAKFRNEGALNTAKRERR